MARSNGIAFAAGQVANIAVVNRATLPLGTPLPKLVRALRIFLRDHFTPVWGIPAELDITQDLVDGAWGLLFVDDVKHSTDMGYHVVTHEGLPLSRVFVRNIRDMNDSVSATACHELCEMLVDPAFNLCAEGPRHVMYAYESADPCENDLFDVDGIAMSDFVYPSWFEGFHKPRSTKFDHRGLIEKPFQLRPDGYISVFTHGGWHDRTGSAKKARKFAKENRDGHRASLRGRPHLMRRSLDPAARQALLRGVATQAPADVGLLDRRHARRAAKPAALDAHGLSS